VELEHQNLPLTSNELRRKKKQWELPEEMYCHGRRATEQLSGFFYPGSEFPQGRQDMVG
jgi:hypothetical protein